MKGSKGNERGGNRRLFEPTVSNCKFWLMGKGLFNKIMFKLKPYSLFLT